MNSDLVYRFKPDTEMDSKMKMHIDLTVAMKCNEMGADILDETNQQFFSFGVLSEDDTWWELCPVQQEYFEYVQSANSYLSEEYHSIAVSRIGLCNYTMLFYMHNNCRNSCSWI